MHFLFLQDRELGLQETVFAAQLGNLRRGGEGARDAVALNDVFELVELFDPGFQGGLEGLIFFPEITLDILHATFEAHHQAFNVVDCLVQVLAEPGQHIGDDGEGDDVAVNQVVGLLPIRAAHARKTVPEVEQQGVALGELFSELLFQGCKALAIGLGFGFELGDAGVFLIDRA